MPSPPDPPDPPNDITPGDDAPQRASRASTLALAVLTGAIQPLTKATPEPQSTLARLGVRLFPPAAPGAPSRLELLGLGTALIGAALVGTTIPGGAPVQAMGAARAPVVVAQAPAPTPAPASASRANEESAGETTADAADSEPVAVRATTASPLPSPTPVPPPNDDTTPAAGEEGDGSDPLNRSGTTLARVALVVVHGDAPARWATAPAGSPAKQRADAGQLLLGVTAFPRAPLANGLAYVAGQPPNPATLAGCSVPAPVAPGTVDANGITTGTGCDYPALTPSIPGAIAREGRTWKAYASGASAAEAAARLCDPAGGPAQRSPLAHLGDLTSSGACDGAAQPLSALQADLMGDTPPAWVYAEVGYCATSLCTAEESAARDTQLGEVLSVLSSTPAPDGGKAAVLVVGDGDPADLAPTDPASGTTPSVALVSSGALLLGDGVAPGTTDPLALDPASIARTQALWLGIEPPGLAADTASGAILAPDA